MLAVLLSACLFASVPAKAQDPVWEATLTLSQNISGVAGSWVGCTDLSNCNSRLTDNTIEVGGTTYTFTEIQYYVSGTSAGLFRLTFTQSTLGSDLRALNFCVGSRAFALSNTGTAWANTNLGWSAGDMVELSIGNSCAPAYTLSVDATPPCGSTVTDTSVPPSLSLVLTPAPTEETETEYRWVTESGEGDWLGALPISPRSGRSSPTPPGSPTFAGLRNSYSGFKGFEYRLKDDHSVTAQCTWTFTEDPPARTPTDQPTTDTGGLGGGFGGGGGEPPPEDEEPSTSCPREDREILVSFYEMTDGKGWHENENWNSAEPLGEWYGVETDDGKVVSLRLPDNNLSGNMPTEELLCLNENTELVELALWDNDDLSGKVPDELVLAVERAALRYLAEMLDINPQWFEDYGDPYDFEDWHEGVTTDDDGRVTGLDFTGERVTGEIPENIFELLPRLGEIMITRSSGDGGCALSPEGSSAFSLFLLTLVVFAVLVRKRAR